jgi:hypothetical protein
MKYSLRLLLFFSALAILTSPSKSQTDLVEEDEPKEDGECSMNLMCQSCDPERAICSTKATPCRFSYFYNSTISSCVERDTEVDFCRRYKDDNKDDAQCAQCVKGLTLYANVALSKWTCEKEHAKHSDFDCIEGCDYCWTRRNSDGTVQKGCAGCAPGYNGVGWIESKIVASCVKVDDPSLRCSEFCQHCTLSAANKPECVGCKDAYILDFKTKLNCFPLPLPTDNDEPN